MKGQNHPDFFLRLILVFVLQVLHMSKLLYESSQGSNEYLQRF